MNNLMGKKFNYLTVIRLTKKRNRRSVVWLCRCDCGNLSEVVGWCLTSGYIKSCGCLRRKYGKENVNYKHGDFSLFFNGQNPIYTIWNNMKARCYNNKDKSYKTYGKRGIRICLKWKNDYFAFKKWALANGYKKGLTIDRINNNDNYEPSNCQWITRSENSKKKWILYRNKNTKAVDSKMRKAVDLL